jgi:hypothetical protein
MNVKVIRILLHKIKNDGSHPAIIKQSITRCKGTLSAVG